MAANPPNPLPEEMMIEIFSRLPTKSVGRCRCLSRFWRSELSNSQFLDLHFTRKPHQENLILITSVSYGESSIVHTIETYAAPLVLKKLDMPEMYKLCGSCNGLVLWKDNQDNLFLVNPVTKEQLTIPPCPYDINCLVISSQGFGYDSLSDDYKIVSIWSLRYDIFNDNACRYNVFVYSVKRGLWVTISNFPHLYFFNCHSGALVNGLLHWSAYDIKLGPVILVFDLATQEFNLIPAPSYATPSYPQLPMYHSTFTLGGCLGNVELADGDKVDVIQGWIMKEYGSRESWTNFTLAVDLGGLGSIRPLCYVGEDDVLFIASTNGQLLLYNLKEHTKKQMLVDTGGVDVFDYGIMFVDSLVSPHRIAISS